MRNAASDPSNRSKTSQLFCEPQSAIRNLFHRIPPSFLAIADQLVFGASNFITTILIARAAGSAELGLYTLGMSLALLGLDLQNSLVLIPYTVYNPRLAGAARARFAGSALLHSLALAAVAALGFMCLGTPPLLAFVTPGFGRVAWALALAAPLLLLRQHARMVAFARLQFGTAFTLDGVVAAVQVGGLFMLSRAHALTGAFQAVLVAALACAAGFALWLAPRRKEFDASPGQAAADFTKNWRFSRWLLTTTPVAVVRSQLCLWLLTAFHGTGSAGFYAACINITSLANPFLTGANNLISTRAAHVRAGEGASALRRFILRATGALGLLMGLFFMMILLFGAPLARAIYGAEYGHLGVALALLAGAVWINTLGAPAYRGLLALERSGATLATEILMLLVQSAAGLWLVYRYALTGAALAILLGAAAGTLYQFSIFIKSSTLSATTDSGNASAPCTAVSPTEVNISL